MAIETKNKKKKRGWALKFSFKKGLEIKAPGMKLKLSRDQLLLGSGVILAVTPVGATALGALAKISAKAGALGLSSLKKVVDYAKDKKISIGKAAKILGISAETVLKEYGRIAKEVDFPAIAEELARDSEADPEMLSGGFNIPIWALGLGLGGVAIIGFNLLRRR